MSEIEIQDLSSNHHYRTELPNIIFEIGLSAVLIGVYAAIKRYAGDHGQCTKSEKKLADELDITKKTLHKFIDQLCEENTVLKKPILKKMKRTSEHGDNETNLITITDIWPENYAFFSIDKGGRVNFTPPRVNITQGVGEILPQGRVKFTHKEQQQKKNIQKEEQQPPTPKGGCVVFSCLEKINDNSITHEHKARITKKNLNNEQRVIDAVNVITHPDFIPQHTLLKSLNAAIKEEWKPIFEEKNESEKNRKLAQDLERKGHNRYTISACKDYLEIWRGGTTLPVIIKYNTSLKKFKEDILKILN